MIAGVSFFSSMSSSFVNKLCIHWFSCLSTYRFPQTLPLFVTRPISLVLDSCICGSSIYIEVIAFAKDEENERQFCRPRWCTDNWLSVCCVPSVYSLSVQLWWPVWLVCPCITHVLVHDTSHHVLLPR